MHNRDFEMVDDIMTDNCAGTRMLCRLRCERINLQPTLIEATMQPKLGNARDVMRALMRLEISGKRVGGSQFDPSTL